MFLFLCMNVFTVCLSTNSSYYSHDSSANKLISIHRQVLKTCVRDRRHPPIYNPAAIIRCFAVRRRQCCHCAYGRREYVTLLRYADVALRHRPVNRCWRHPVRWVDERARRNAVESSFFFEVSATNTRKTRHAGPVVWNSIPLDIRSAPTL